MHLVFFLVGYVFNLGILGILVHFRQLNYVFMGSFFLVTPVVLFVSSLAMEGKYEL